MATTSNLQLVISAEDKATSTLKKVQGQVSKLGPPLKAIGVAAGVVGGAMAAFGAKSVKAFIDAEAQTARSAQKINNAVEGMSAKQEKAMQKLADADAGQKGAKIYDFLIKKMNAAGEAAVQLGFDDEDAADSFATLFQRTNDVNKAMELNALAMNLSRAKGIELADASRMVGLVLSGNARALKEYGIELKEGQKPMAALGELSTKVGGQAAAFADTTAGKIEILRIRFANLQEEIGATLANALTPFLNKMLEFSKSEEGRRQIQVFTQAVVTMATVVGKAIGTVIGLAQKLGEALGNASVAAERKWKNFADSIHGVIKKAADNIDKLIAGYNRVASKLKMSTISEIRYRQFGGGVDPGRPYIVGEQRPEVFVPHQSGNIKQMGQAGGSVVTINFNNPVVRDEMDLRALVQTVKDEIARTQNLERYGIRAS